MLRIDYSLLIRSTNSSGVSISIFEKPNCFLLMLPHFQLMLQIPQTWYAECP